LTYKFNNLVFDMINEKDLLHFTVITSGLAAYPINQSIINTYIKAETSYGST